MNGSLSPDDELRLRRSEAIDGARACNVTFAGGRMLIELTDGRELSVPIEWFPRLAHATEEERARWTSSDEGRALHWEDIDEDIGVDHLVLGWPSGEGRTTLQRWLDERSKQKTGHR